MNGNIYINGVIGTFLDENGKVLEKGVELLDVILQVKNQPKAESFTVYINSQGGYVDVGFEIYDYLKSLGKPIKTIGQGMVASIATVIFMAGDKRVLKPNTEFMIHLPSGGIDGNSDEIEWYSKMMKDVEKRIVKFYNETAGLSESEILPLLQKETFLNADEAYKLGFSNEKINAPEVVAYFKPNLKPKINMSKNEKGIISKIMDVLKSHKIPTNKIVFDAEGKELDFYELEDSATIELGAKANYDGKPANGEYAVPSENDPALVETYEFKNGVLIEIKQADVAAEEEADSEEMQALKAENENLKTQLAEKDTAIVDLTGEVTALKESNSAYKKAIAAIKAIETEHTPAQPAKQPISNRTAEPKNTTSEAVANWRKNKQLKTKK
jgi:ATP-dependent Clp endopeptidase proteolytic subunit ClpP